MITQENVDELSTLIGQLMLLMLEVRDNGQDSPVEGLNLDIDGLITTFRNWQQELRSNGD